MKEYKPLVSIITPSFNSYMYIEGTIKSVEEQNYPNIEHIVVDGRSMDGTIDILKKYGDKITWMSEPDRGMYDAINKGFSIARGEILTYINSDDRYYSENVVSMVVDAFERNKLIDFIYGHCAFIESGTVLYIYKAPFFHRKLALAYPRIIFHQPTCFWRKRVHICFDTSFKYCADSHFFQYLCQNHVGKNIQQIIAKFMVRKDNLSALYYKHMKIEGERLFGKNADHKIPLYLRMIDLLYIRTFLNLRANLKRLYLHYQGRPFL